MTLHNKAFVSGLKYIAKLLSLTPLTPLTPKLAKVESLSSSLLQEARERLETRV
jgi:hypothetical protein